MTIHTLEKEKHNDFLQQKRIDPITGDILQEGDQVVICASCKSAFLVDSWEYMYKKHCNQRITLKEIPVNEIVRMERPYLIDFEGKIIPNSKQETIKTTYYYFFLGYFIAYLLDHFAIIAVSYSAMIVMSIYYYYINYGYEKSSYKNILLIKNNTLFFDKKKSQYSTLKLEEIEHVKLYKSKRHSFRNLIRYLSSPNNSLYTIKITDKNRKVYKVLLEKKELERISRETNLLQKFNKNLPNSISVHKKIEQHTA